MKSCAAIASVAVLLHTALAHAQLPKDGQPIATNGYGIDLYQGPVLASTRVIGLAGAFVAISEGVEGATQNPAAPAVRVPWSTEHLDFDLSIGVTFPSTLKNSDFFNSGRRTDLPKGTTGGGFVFFNAAANLQFGKWGLGVTTDLQSYALNRSSSATSAKSADELVASISITHIQLARAFADGQLIVGGGTRTTTLSVQNQSATDTAQRDLFSTVGTGFETGLLIRPNDEQFRIGAAFRSAVTTRASSSNTVHVVYDNDPLNRLYLPNYVTLPWDLDLGLAIELGPRPLNPVWRDPVHELGSIKRFMRWRELERARKRRAELARVAREHGDQVAAANALDAELEIEAALDEYTLYRTEEEIDEEIRRRDRERERFHVLVTSSLVVSGAAHESVGIESFLERTTQRSGTGLSYSPRLAIETESVPHWLQLRAGTYLEPSRFPSNRDGARIHGTLGFDQKLFHWDVFGLYNEHTHWRVGGSLDAARNYFGWSVAIGVWH